MNIIQTLIVDIDVLQIQEERLQAELAQKKAELAVHMGEQTTLGYRGLVAKKWPQVRYHVDTAYLVNALPIDVINWFHEPVFNKKKIDAAKQAGIIAPAVADKAIDKKTSGWVVSVKRVDRA